MPRIPSGLWGYVKADTHSVGWETGVITPFLTISLRVHSICSLYLMRTFLQACGTEVTLQSVLKVQLPDIFPMILKKAGKAHFRVSMSWTMVVVQEADALVYFALRADLDFKLGI